MIGGKLSNRFKTTTWLCVEITVAAVSYVKSFRLMLRGQCQTAFGVQSECCVVLKAVALFEVTIK